MKRLVWYCLSISAIVAGCSKPDGIPPVVIKPPQSTIQAVGGANQSDTVGAKLLDSIIVKINEPGSHLNKYLVKIFQKTLCNDDSVSQRVVLNGQTISYQWKLGGTPGVQTLKFQVLDSTQKVVDSLNITATVKPPKSGWHPSACVIAKNLFVHTFAKTSTGRLLTGFMGDFYPLYSDDNGISWHQMKSFYFGYYPWVEKIVVSPTDELYIASELNGIYYSADGGKTWENRSNGIQPLSPFSDLALTPLGQLIFLSSDGGVYISANKGVNWSVIKPRDNNPNSLYARKFMAQTPNGDMYFTNTENISPKILKLDHATFELAPIDNQPPVAANAFFIDKDGNWYIGGRNPANGAADLYQSTDEGLTWNKIFSHASEGSGLTTIANISLQSDGNYYFEVFDLNGYCFKTADFKTIENIPLKVPVYSGQYILAANNYFLINSFPISIWYDVP